MVKTDVLIVGFGGAGAAAAIEAYDAGAQVLILEKMPFGGGNTCVSAGGIMVPDSQEAGYAYLRATFGDGEEKDDRLLEIFTREVMEAPAFLRRLGVENLEKYGGAGFPHLPCSSAIHKYRIPGQGCGGQRLFEVYRKAVEDDRGIKVLYNTRALKLKKNAQGRVGLVVASSEGKEFEIEVAKGVILACGGFECAPDMLEAAAKAKPILTLGTPANSGDGLRMAREVGAKFWHMQSYSCPLGIRIPGHQAAYMMSSQAASMIWVDQDGKRFVNEYGLDTHDGLSAVKRYDAKRGIWPRIPAWCIFDEKARRAGPITRGLMGIGWLVNKEGYVWSADNSQEIASGVIKVAPTVEELAAQIGLEPRMLVSTIENWNRDISEGLDRQFGRALVAKTRTISEPLDLDGPLYAMALYPALLNTQGGPRRDESARALSEDGSVIPGLFVVGELGSMWGAIYQGACNNAEALVFGRLAGRAAAAS